MEEEEHVRRRGVRLKRRRKIGGNKRRRGLSLKIRRRIKRKRRRRRRSKREGG